MLLAHFGHNLIDMAGKWLRTWEYPARGHFQDRASKGPHITSAERTRKKWYLAIKVWHRNNNNTSTRMSLCLPLRILTWCSRGLPLGPQGTCTTVCQCEESALGDGVQIFWGAPHEYSLGPSPHGHSLGPSPWEYSPGPSPHEHSPGPPPWSRRSQTPAGFLVLCPAEWSGELNNCTEPINHTRLQGELCHFLTSSLSVRMSDMVGKPLAVVANAFCVYGALRRHKIVIA